MELRQQWEEKREGKVGGKGSALVQRSEGLDSSSH